MIKIYASIFVVLLNICFVLSHVITIEVKGRLLCNGKEHGKVGLDGWPKKVYLWDMTDDVPVTMISGLNYVNNRKGIFYLKGVEVKGVPVGLRIYHHCYNKPTKNENVNEKFSSMKDCYMVNTLEVPEQYLNDERWLVELNNTEGYLDPTCLPY